MTTKIDPRIEAAFKAANGFSLVDNVVLFVQIGSHSHGTYIPSTDPDAIDDVDYMGIVVPSATYTLGLGEWDNWTWQSEELDVVIYSLKKAMSLLAKGNPNIVGILWLPEEHILECSEAGRWLIEERDLFSSKELYHSFTGYAHGQFTKMLSFPTEQMEEYNLHKAFITAPRTGIQDETSHLQDAKFSNLEHSAKFVLDFEKKYFSGYMGEKRKNMVLKYGYDVKNASHLIRLLRMGKEFFEQGTLNVFREHDAEELKDIKKGQYSLDQIKVMAEELFEKTKIAKDNSSLPEKADRKQIDALLVSIHLYYILKELHAATG